MYNQITETKSYQRSVVLQNRVEDKKSSLIGRNVTVHGRRTSMRMEPEMWKALKDIATREKCSIHDLVSLVAMKKKRQTSLTTAVRIFLLLYYRAACTEVGHVRAQHGDFNMMRKRALGE